MCLGSGGWNVVVVPSLFCLLGMGVVPVLLVVGDGGVGVGVGFGDVGGVGVGISVGMVLVMGAVGGVVCCW